MKGVLTGLKDLKKLSSDKPTGGGSYYLKLRDGQSAQIRFLQELDESGKNYDEARGLGRAVFEHSNPDDFRQKFVCTLNDEGKCAGCERVPMNPRWKKNSRLYINVFNLDDNVSQIVATGFSPKGIGGTLIEYAEDFGSICDRNFKLKRTGESIKTSYSLFPREISDFDLAKPQVHDLDTVVRYRTYDECLEMLNPSDANITSGW